MTGRKGLVPNFQVPPDHTSKAANGVQISKNGGGREERERGKYLLGGGQSHKPGLAEEKKGG